MLECHVTGRHTAENIMLWYKEITSDFDVSEKIKHIVIDSGSNIKKKFLSLPGYEDATSDSRMRNTMLSVSVMKKYMY